MAEVNEGTVLLLCLSQVAVAAAACPQIGVAKETWVLTMPLAGHWFSGLFGMGEGVVFQGWCRDIKTLKKTVFKLLRSPLPFPLSCVQTQASPVPDWMTRCRVARSEQLVSRSRSRGCGHELDFFSAHTQDGQPQDHAETHHLSSHL